MVKTLESRGISVATVNRYLTSFKTLMLRAFRVWGVTSSIPVIELTAEQNQKLRFITREEEELLLRGCDRLHLTEMKQLICVLLDTGFRLSEALNVHPVKDINDGMVTSWFNKANKPRSVPLTNRVREILKAKEGSTRLFTLSVAQAEFMWKALKKYLKMDDKELTLHTLRHTYASRLVQAGIGIYIVKDLLGHKTLKMTERYAHLSVHNYKDAIAVLNTF
jgi:integrase